MAASRSASAEAAGVGVEPRHDRLHGRVGQKLTWRGERRSGRQVVGGAAARAAARDRAARGRVAVEADVVVAERVEVLHQLAGGAGARVVGRHAHPPLSCVGFDI